MSDNLSALESEGVVLGTLIVSPETIPKTLLHLKTEDFIGGEGVNFTIFSTIEQLAIGGRAVDVSSILKAIQLAGGDPAPVAEFLPSALDSVTQLEALETHIELIREASKKRQTIQILEEALEKAQSWETPTEELWQGVNERAFNILRDTRSQTQHFWAGGGEEHGLYAERMRILKAKETADPIYTGWEELDSLLPTGFTRGDISVCAGRPGMGKSSLVQNATGRFLDRDYGGVKFATEQSKEVETDRQDSILTQIPLYDVSRTNTWQPQDSRLEVIKEANRYMDEKWNYDVVYGRQLDMAQVWEWMSVITRQRDKDFVIIDLFDRLTDVNVSANKPQTVSKKLGEAAALAEHFYVHLILVVQIGRTVERRANKRPTLSDLKDSGNYEEAARLVMLMYRDAYYNPESLDNTMELCIAKQNQGEAGPGVILPFSFDPGTLIYEPQAARGV